MNSKHAFLALSTFTLVSIAYGEREVFAPTKLAPVAEAGTIKFDNGTAPAPSMTFKSDDNTGIYRAGADTIGFTTNGNIRAAIDGYNMCIGNNVAASAPQNGTLSATSGSGTNIAGASMTIRGGNSTGNAAGGHIAFQTAAAGAAGATNNTLTERMRIDSAGRMLVNHTASVNVGAGAGQVQISGVDGNSALQSIARYSADGSGPTLAFGKSRNATIGGQTAVANGDRIGLIAFAGSDGNDMDNNGGAGIQSSVDGAVSTGNVPSRLEFITTAAGGSQTERMRISSTGLVGIGTTPSVLLDVLNPSTAASSEIARFRGDTASTPFIGFFNGANRTGYIQYSATSLFVGADTNKNINITTSGTGDIFQNTGGAERMRITSGGEIVAGNGDTSATPAASTIRGTNASGTNIGGPSLTIQAGRGTGTGAGGALVFQTSAAGTTGSTLNAATERMRIDSAGDVYIGNGLTAASPTAGTIRGTSGSGTNIAGAGLVVVPGQGTGSGAGGPFRVLTAPAGTSGSSLNAAVERVRVKQGGQVRFVPLAAAPTLDVEDGDVYYNSTTNKLQVRAAGVWVDLH